MNRPHVFGFGEEELAMLNARVDAYVLDEDAWTDATDQSDVDYEMLCRWQQRSSTFDSVD